MREEVGGVVGECQSSEYRDEIDVGGGEVGEEAVSVRYETNRLAGRMKCVIVTANAPRKIRKPWKEIVLVGVTGKLYLLIKLTLLLSIRGKVKHGRKSSDISLCSNQHKGKKTQTILKYIQKSGMNYKAVNQKYT
ncbi:hypothetical protein T09_1294 [Trichinella sp. T9]|nr:hypothetical protein T09_1294 [Trichinella sp. T9]